MRLRPLFRVSNLLAVYRGNRIKELDIKPEFSIIGAVQYRVSSTTVSDEWKLRSMNDCTKISHKLKTATRREMRLVDRTRRAWEMRQLGMTYSEIGGALGRADDPSMPISGDTAKLLAQQWKSRLDRSDDLLAIMSKRAFNILKIESTSMGEPLTKELARSLIERGDLIRTPNCGNMTIEEIKEWAYS